MKSSLLNIILVSLVITSCKLSTDDYVSYLLDHNNGLALTQQSNVGSYTLKYRPIDLMIASEKENTNQSATELKESFGDLEYYLLEVKKKSPANGDKASFYYAYQFEKDIYRIENQDTIRPTLFQLDQGISGSAHMRVNLAFLPSESDKNIVIADKYGSKISFEVLQQDIDNLPKLSM